MAADQPNKRFKASNAVGHTSREQQKAKRKKLEFPHNDLNMRSNISLEWDDNKKNVIPKKEQIGISLRELGQFLAYPPYHMSILGDVFAAPPEIFELDNLTDVLSYEVWQTHLSEQERNFLTQFLPEGFEIHEVVHDLLAGNNFHFGNQSLKWGVSLCSGDCHPDAILRQEQCNKSNKIAYYTELQSYHTEMIGSLQMWKERWARCKNSEEDFMQKILRSREGYDKSGSTHMNRLPDPEDNLGASSDSFSWDADEKACSSDSPNLTVMHNGTSKLISRKDCQNKFCDSSDGRRAAARPRKGEKLRKPDSVCSGVAKYMSYIKVSKEQHRRVRSSMKHSSSSIQPKSLNHVLGNLDTLCVQPYEIFEEEERQKLHKHWLKLVKEDLPAGYENWSKWQSAKWQLAKSLEEEMKAKLKWNDLSVLDLCNTDEEKKDKELSLHGINYEFSGNRSIDTPEDEEKERPPSSLALEHMDSGTTDNEPSVVPEDNEEKSDGSVFQSEADTGAAKYDTAAEVAHGDESHHASAQNHHPQQIALLDDSHDFCPLDMNSNNNVLVKSDAFPSTIGGYTENISHTDVPVGEGDPLSSAACEIWPAVSLPSDYYHQPTSMSLCYASTGELSLPHPQVRQDQPSQVIDLESVMQQEDRHRSLLHRQSNGDESFFNQYPNQNRNELLLQSLFKNTGSSPHHHEQKPTRLGFLPAERDLMLETGHFPGNTQDSMVQLDLRQKRSSDLYIHQNIQGNMYAEGNGRFSVQRQEHFLPLNHVQDWSVNGSVGMPASSHPQLNGGELLGHNWLCGGHQVRDGWSGSVGAVGPNQDVGNDGSHVADQTLFSVLSQCNGLHSGIHYDSMGTMERFIQTGNYGGAAGVAVPTTSSFVLPGTVTGAMLDYLSGNESQSGLQTNGIGWMSLPHQNAPLQDTLGKSFSQSWNRLG